MRTAPLARRLPAAGAMALALLMAASPTFPQNSSRHAPASQDPVRRAAPAGASELRDLIERHVAAGLDLLRQGLAIPNNARMPEQVAANVAWAEQVFGARGFVLQRLETGGPPLLLASHPAGPLSAAAPTVLVYFHLDGQPVDPARWSQADPYVAVLKEPDGEGWREIPWSRLSEARNPDWRLFARSVSDDKGPMAELVTALDAMRQANLELPFNLKLIMDFEEELGSPHLPAAVQRHKEALAADALLIFDGPRHPGNQPTLVFGARGIATISLTVHGPRAPQHSGHYGNYAPNPAMLLARLLATMKDDQGRVTIPGFYDGVQIDDATRQLLAATPDDEPAMRRQLGIAAADHVGATYQESLQYPSLNVRGLASGWVGDAARTIVPASATAEIDIRLVPESDARRLIDLVRLRVEAQGYKVLDRPEPSEAERAAFPRLASFSSEISYGAFVTPVDSEVGRWLTRALSRGFGAPPVRIRMQGGSVPIAPFVQALRVPAVIVPGVNSNNSQHSPDENLRLGNFVDGARGYLAILTEPWPQR